MVMSANSVRRLSPRIPGRILCAAIIAVLTLPACGDDGDSPPNNQGTNNGGTNNGGTNNGGTNNGGTNNGGTNNGGTNNGGGPCDGIEDCTPGTPADYPHFGAGTFFHSVLVDGDADGIDIDGDGMPDNALGPLIEAASQALGLPGINDQFANAIADGRLSMGAVVTDDRVDFLHLVDHDGDLGTRDQHYLHPNSLYDGTATAKARFGVARTGDEVASTSGDYWLVVPIGEVLLQLPIADPVLSGTLGADGELSTANIAGALPVSGWIDGLNDYLLSDNCTCLALDQPLIDAEQGCTTTFDGSSCQDLQTFCASIAAACELLPQLLASHADIDLDNDGEADAISAWVTLEGSPTFVVGPAP
jgi:hypothetical protein